jgi:outer membrane protein assembly factor BamB
MDADAAKGSKAEGSISADGKRVVVSVCSNYFFGRPQDATLWAWDVADGKKLFEGTVAGARGENGAVVLAPDGKTAYLSSLRGQAFALDPTTGKIRRKFGSEKLQSTAHIVLSQDGKQLAVSEETETRPNKMERAVCVYDAATGKRLHEIATQDTPVAFAPDNRSLATRSQHAILIWELPGQSD